MNAVDVPVPPLATGSVPVTPVVRGSPVALVSVADAGVPNAIELPLPSLYIPCSAGYVTNTFFVPALKLTAVPPLLDSNIVSRDKVVPEDVYVPRPTSHSVLPTIA